MTLTSTFGNAGAGLALGSALLTLGPSASTLYAGLHFADPNAATDPSLTEFLGAGYVRQPIKFVYGVRAVGNSAGVEWHGLPANTVGWIAVWDDAANFNLRCQWQLSPGIAVPLNGSFFIAANDLTVAL